MVNPKAIQDETTRICSQLLKPHVLSDDRECFFRREVFFALSQAKAICQRIPSELGGGGGSTRNALSALEAIARTSLAMAVSCSVSQLTQNGLLDFGNEDQKQRYLPRIASGEYLGAFSLSEPQAGSDAASVRLVAEPVPGGYRLRGNKLWCSNAGNADLYCLMARTSPHRTEGMTAFLIEKTYAGFRPGKQEKKLGLHSSSLAELILEDCFVPQENILGGVGKGLYIALSLLDGGRLSIGACALAVAKEAIHRAIPLLQGGPCAEANLASLGHFFGETLAIDALITKTAQEKDQGLPYSTAASAVKLLGTVLAERALQEITMMLGPQGVVEEFGFERMLRDVRALPITEGTTQIQQRILAKKMEEGLRGSAV